MTLSATTKPRPRRWRPAITIGGFVATLLSMIVFGLVANDIVPFIHGIVLAVPAALVLYSSTRGRTVRYSSIILAALYLLGYPLKALVAVLYSGNFGDPVGRFGFSDDEWNAVVTVVLFGMAGVILGQMLGKIGISGRNERFENRLSHGARGRHFGLWITLWFCGVVGLNGLMAYLGVGRTGIALSAELPFRLAGILYYTRLLVVPLVSLCLMEAALRSKSMLLPGLLTILIALEAALYTLTSLSRSGIIYRLVPLILYLSIGRSEDRRARRLAWYAVVAAFVILVALPGVTSIRNLVFTAGGRINAEELSGFAPEAFGLENLLAHATEALTFPAARTLGLPGVMAVVAHPDHGVDILYQALTSSYDYTESVFGIIRPKESLVYSGVGVGLFGLLSLSGNLLVVFLGAAFASGILIWLEGISRRIFSGSTLAAPVSCAMGSLFAFAFWEADPRFIGYGLIVSSLGILVIRLAINRRIVRE